MIVKLLSVPFIEVYAIHLTPNRLHPPDWWDPIILHVASYHHFKKENIARAQQLFLQKLVADEETLLLSIALA